MSRAAMPSRRTLAALAVALVAAALLARTGATWLETSLFTWIVGWPGWLGDTLAAVAPLGSGLAVFAAPALVAVFDREAAWQVWLSAGLSWAAALLAKVAVGRVRAGELVDAPLAAFDALGFPSGHTAVVVGIVTGLWPWLGLPGRVVASTAAVAVGLARVQVGAHLPLDVVGGALVGALVGLAVQAVLAGSRR